MSVPVPLPRRAAGAVLGALALLLACAGPEDTATAPETDAPAATPAPRAEATTPEPAPPSPATGRIEPPDATQPSVGGVLPAGAGGEPAPRAERIAPASAGLEPAANVVSDPQLAADSGAASRASAQWGNRGPDVDARSPWRGIAWDGIHDPEGDAAGLLQPPGRALASLPRANSGNLIDWVAAIETGAIRPRARTGSQGAMEVLDKDVLLVDTKNMPYVVFPHKGHTEWLACSNCHDWLFKKKAGSTDISMASIARGQSCGLCHGKVAFPPTECFRCHSGPRPK